MNENIGLDMKVEYATVHDTGGSLKSNYCEDTIIEYEFNINKDTDSLKNNSKKFNLFDKLNLN